eukprot:scaffold9561_cov126-Amphora_coffeaeformis.AAC.1
MTPTKLNDNRGLMRKRYVAMAAMPRAVGASFVVVVAVATLPSVVVAATAAGGVAFLPIKLPARTSKAAGK